MINRTLIVFVLSVLANVTLAQKGTIRGKVLDENGDPIPVAVVALKNTVFSTETNTSGDYELKSIPPGSYIVMAFSSGKAVREHEITLRDDIVVVSFTLRESVSTLAEVTIDAERERTMGMKRLESIDNFGLYEGKKTEVVVLGDLTANTSTNNARQIYSKVTGLNIWESDGAGLQLGIGGRGLSPNRTSNFNVRQNGYDISADALGYPESYYTPPAEALDQIEIIRGAASLQYGTQFGGLLNFRFKKGPVDKKIEFTSRQTIGAWNFFGTFNSVGGTVAKDKLNYFAYYNFKRGDGYRPNAEFDYHNAYASLNYQVTEKLLVNFDFTKMDYLAHQAGGLTAALFDENPRQSLRARNWFKVDWNLVALNFTYAFNPRTQLNIRNFGLIASRKALGNLDPINISDLGERRTMIDGEFKNVGNETRLLHRYELAGKNNAFVAGFRIYRGTTTARQGDADNGSGATFTFNRPDDLENSDYRFPNENYAVFVENVFDISKKISLTPGLRYENIRTYSSGYYQNILRDNAGNIVVKNRIDERLSRERGFLLGGLGVTYRHRDDMEVYANVSQNYRAINFSDLRISNPNLVVDSLIHDEKGFTADLGIRGMLQHVFRYEATLFYLAYKGRIGQELREYPVLFKDYRYRTNVSDSRNIGVEAFGELTLSKILWPDSHVVWSMFVNASVIDARYVNARNSAIEHNAVEMVPPVMIRSGTTIRHHHLSATLQSSWVAKHYSDATNAEWTASAIEGEIPSYFVVDLSTSYTWKILTMQVSCNNMLDTHYYTRRADSYPGPGIIPADGRGFYATVQVKVGK